jgi:hypothetical protein
LESVGFGELDERGSRHTGTAPEIVDGGKGIVRPCRDNLGGVGVGEPLDHAQAKANLDTMVARIAHDLGGGTVVPSFHWTDAVSPMT